MDITVSFPGGKKVDAQFGDFVVKTDQSVKEGGEASAPSPFEYFLASLGSCAGFYVLSYLQARDLPCEGVKIVQSHQFNQKSHRLEKICLKIVLPPEIDSKHHKPIVRSAQKCSVKRLIESPPEFEISASVE
jgi:ribosomal protein S12 methylthiotransferase accessory factor